VQPDRRFLHKSSSFWACVRTVSQEVGYTVRLKKIVKVPTLEQMASAFDSLGLDSQRIRNHKDEPTKLASELLDYFKYRANALNKVVEPLLMNAEEAKREFCKLKKKLKPKCPLPMNKQKGSKKAEAYFTCIINMIIEANAHDYSCDYDPRKLTTVTKNGAPLRTLARRVDGAFPTVVNPIAVWEIKEYYYTTTFGSRVADGVYETLLDGMELQELRVNEGIDVKHYLMIDSHFTWWECGRPYLCRIVDMMHMGFVDEVFFGKEVFTRLPSVVAGWRKEVKKTKKP